MTGKRAPSMMNKRASSMMGKRRGTPHGHRGGSMMGGEARLNLAGGAAAARLIANGEQDGEAIRARRLQ